MTSKLKHVVVSWSSGKDSCLCLLELLDNPAYKVTGLFTTHVKNHVPFQETPLDVIKMQAERLNLPLITAELPKTFPDNNIYQKIVVDHLKNTEIPIDAIAFGDMFCNGIEDYRRSFLEPAGFECVFPLLGQTPESLSQEILKRNIETQLITVDTSQLDGQFVGRNYNQQLLNELPSSVDPCGENGEFHTLVTNAPCFSHPINITLEGINKGDRFHVQKFRVG